LGGFEVELLHVELELLRFLLRQNFSQQFGNSRVVLVGNPITEKGPSCLKPAHLAHRLQRLVTQITFHYMDNYSKEPKADYQRLSCRGFAALRNAAKVPAGLTVFVGFNRPKFGLGSSRTGSLLGITFSLSFV
jgi:hypothetical protein